ncbi:MAG: PTS fructose transporter subunit IIA [Deltaproteobacteria bacterium]|nr:PTS fructose transporter subunit IIA [Deltaproteobacteria bacterium]
MIGTVVVCHGKIGLEMVRIAQSIVRDASPMVAVSIEHDEDVNRTRHKISDAIREVQQEGGVLLMTDMFGGTPSNLCLSFLEGKKVEVIAGVNLPMLIKLASYKEDKPLAEVATFIQNYGQKNIALAGKILEGS